MTIGPRRSEEGGRPQEICCGNKAGRPGWGGLRMGGILNTIDGDYDPRSVHREG